MPGLSFWRREVNSVSRDATTPVEMVVDARGDHIDVLMDAVGAENAAGRDTSQNALRCGADALVTHEEVIVLERNRPIRREADFNARSDHTAPTRVIHRVEQPAVGGHGALELIVGH